MHDYYSVQALNNLLFWPVTSRFANHLSSVSDETARHSVDGQHYSDSPIYRDTGCSLFPSCLSCPLSTCKGDLGPKDLRRQLRALRNRQTSSQVTAQGE